jgi:hypothetical protein
VIIKCLSRKSDVGQLIRYVMADTKIEPEPKRPARAVYVPGVQLTKDDLKYLESERSDAALLHEFKLHSKDGNIAKFVEEHILKQYGENGKGKLPATVFKQNIQARSIQGYIKAFDDNEKLRVHVRNNNVKAYHHILSFSKLDKGQMREDMLKDITRQYISLRGENSLFVGAVHQDREHIHIHLVQSGVQYMTGLANRVSRQQFQELKVAMQEYQMKKYPELVHSLPNHKLKNRGMDEKKIKTDERASGKKALVELLTATFERTSFKEDFLDELSQQGHQPYYRNGRLQGVMAGDRKYRFSTLGFKEQVDALDRLPASEKTNTHKTDKYEQAKQDEYKAMKEAGKMVEADWRITEKVQKEIEEERQLKELEQLRSGRRSRSLDLEAQKKPEYIAPFSEATRGKSESEVMEMQQHLVNQNKQFEKEHGIIRDAEPSIQPQSPNGLPDFDMNKLCDDCKTERDDLSYDIPKYYTNGTFDFDKYSNHMLEEFMNTVSVEYETSLGASMEDPGVDTQDANRALDDDRDELVEADPSSSDDRNKDESEDELERDGNDFDMER